MIPYAIFSAKLDIDNRPGVPAFWAGTLEVCALELSTEGFIFRVSSDIGITEIESAGSICLHFYRFEKADYRELKYDKNMTGMSSFEIHMEQGESTEYYHVYRFKTDDWEYQSCANQLMREYMRYIDLKLEDNDALLSEKLTGYPAKDEEIDADCLESQRKQWFSHFTGDEWNGVDESCYELGVSIDNTEAYENYLGLCIQDFMREYWLKNGFDGSAHPITKIKISYLYIGNQFCHLLFPKSEPLFRILEKAVREGIKPVVVFTYLQEHDIAEVHTLIERLGIWCRTKNQRIELVVNDWGMLSMIANVPDHDWFDITLGVLLNKRRKDTRLQYKNGIEHMLLRENALQSEAYCRYLQENFNVSRVSQESCGYHYDLPSGTLKSTLLFPFYQMNTSQHCTLYADIKNGARGRQCAVTQCPEYCSSQAFLYPTMLNMVGRYNTLFGYDTHVMFDGAYVSYFLKQGVDRLVVNLI